MPRALVVTEHPTPPSPAELLRPCRLSPPDWVGEIGGAREWRDGSTPIPFQTAIAERVADIQTMN